MPANHRANSDLRTLLYVLPHVLSLTCCKPCCARLQPHLRRHCTHCNSCDGCCCPCDRSSSATTGSLTLHGWSTCAMATRTDKAS